MKRRDFLIAGSGLSSAICLAQNPAGAQPASRAHIKPALCAYTFRDALQKKKMSYEDLVRFAADNGMDGLDATSYWFPDPVDDSFLFSLKRTPLVQEIHIYTLGVNTTLTKADRDARRQQVQLIGKWVDIAEKIGASQLRVFGGKPPQGAAVAQAAAWATESLKQAVSYAGSRGILIAMENHSGVTQDSDVLLRMVKDVDSPWFGVDLDTGNFPQRPYEQIAACVRYAVSAHIKTKMMDAEKRAEPADLDRVFRIFAEGGDLGLCHWRTASARIRLPPYPRSCAKWRGWPPDIRERLDEIRIGLRPERGRRVCTDHPACVDAWAETCESTNSSGSTFTWASAAA